jgi:molybdate transport system substrate-binding protein
VVCHRRQLPAKCATLAAALVLSLIGCSPQKSKPSVTVAAAANLTDVFTGIGRKFEAQTGIHPVFSFASTAQLTLQIENAAPFDVFAAADSDHVAQLDKKGLLSPGTRAVYARGVLALWIPDDSAAIQDIRDLTSPRIRVVALAKPDLAPYGQAAVETLHSLNVWDAVQPKLVYAENISVATQYGKSKNADVVFTAYSLVLHESGKVIRVDERLHRPIDQELGIISRSAHQADARKFTAFLLGGEGKSILAATGYTVP